MLYNKVYRWCPYVYYTGGPLHFCLYLYLHFMNHTSGENVRWKKNDSYKWNCHEKDRGQEALMPLLRFLVSIVQHQVWRHQTRMQVGQVKSRTPCGLTKVQISVSFLLWTCGKRQVRLDIIVTYEPSFVGFHIHMIIIHDSQAHCIYMVLRKSNPMILLLYS